MTEPKLHVYIAGRSEDQAHALALRDRLEKHGIGCTSTWLKGFEDNWKKGALLCLTDIARADVVVMVNPRDVHRSGTGGRHTEVGIAIGQGKPVVVIGAAENVFHHLDIVRVVPSSKDGGSITDVVAAVRELTEARAANDLGSATSSEYGS